MILILDITAIACFAAAGVLRAVKKAALGHVPAPSRMVPNSSSPDSSSEAGVDACSVTPRPAGLAGKKENTMSNDNDLVPSKPSFVSRVFTNDSFKKGLGTAVAGLLVATVVEAIWPSGDRD